MALSWTIGSKPDSDLVVDLPKVSGHHCRLTRDDDGHFVEDLGSTNGTYVNGVRINDRTRVTRGDSVTLGVSIPMPWPAESNPPKAVVFRIGRGPDNDLVLNLPTVADYHAQIVWEGKPGDVTIEDLGSSGGTAVGTPDRKINRSVLSADDIIYLGTHALPAAPILARIDPALVPRLSLLSSEMVIGREADCDRVLDLPMVSAHHARLYRADDRILIRDLGSSNGTFVNGRRIDGEVAVKPGDLIGLGSYTLVLADDSRDSASKRDGPASPTPSRPGDGPSRGWADLLRRSPSIFDPARRLTALLGQAPLAALLIILGTKITSPAPTIPGASEVSSRTIAAILYWLGLAAIWFGLSNAVLGRLLDPTRLREGPRWGGVAHLCSRMIVLGMLCLCQCAAAWFLVAYLAGLQGPGFPMLGLLILASGVGMALGLLLVAPAPRPETIWGLLALAVVAIGLLGGGPWPLSRMPSWARTAAGANPLRWTYEGLLLLESGRAPSGAVRGGSGPGPVRELAEVDFPADSLRMGTRADVMALALMGIGLTATAGFIASERGRRT